MVKQNFNKISDLVVRLNSNCVSHTLKCIYTLENISILKILENEGLITIDKIDYLNNHIYLHKNELDSEFKKSHYAYFQVISKPSKKVYANLYTRHKNTHGNSQLDNLGINHNLGLDFYILRTSKGIMTNKKAYSYNKHGIGGEVLIRVSVSK
jgi:ribosomal protein S8